MQDLEPIDRADPSITALVTGIINDGQELMRQQLALFKSELRHDLTRAQEAGTILAIGGATMALGGVVLALMLAHLLNWALETPTWAGFGLVGGALTVLGLVLFMLGRNKLAALNPLPDETVRAVKESVQWLKNPR